METGTSMRVVVLAALACSACASPRDDYENFLARTTRDLDGGDPVVQSRLENVSGIWLTHALLAGGLDLGLKMELTMDPMKMPIPIHCKIWLATANIKTETPLVESDSTVNSDGTFVLHAEPLIIPAGASPGLNSEVAANVVLQASTTGVDTFCGTATGNVTKPLVLDLKGSTFAARRDAPNLRLMDVPQSCFPKKGGNMPVDVPRPVSPDLSAVSSVEADLTGHWIVNAKLAGSVPLKLWASLNYIPGPMGGGSLDGALRRATDPVGSVAVATFGTTVSPEGRFEVWLPNLSVGTIQASVLLVGATRDKDTFCGLGAGQVPSLMLDLKGSTFAAVRWVPGTPVPDPLPEKCL